MKTLLIGFGGIAIGFFLGLAVLFVTNVPITEILGIAPSLASIGEWRATLQGEVIKKEEGMLRVMVGGTELNINVTEETSVVLNSFGPPPQGTIESQKGSLEDIQVKDLILLELVANATGGIRADQIIIIQSVLDSE
ncbi:MAG: hypothetical protein Q8P70_01140 [bacterium]|nr:hypothetical protein [bacterium]